MNNQFLNQNSLIPMGIPFQALMELNVKTLQSFSYVTPEQLLKIKKPEELLEKNIEVCIENGHKALDYMQDTFSLLERHWLNMSSSLQESSKQMMSKGQSTFRSNMNQMVDSAKDNAKKMTSTIKKGVKQSQSLMNAGLKSKSATKKTTAQTKKKTAAPTRSHSAKATTHSSKPVAKTAMTKPNEMMGANKPVSNEDKTLSTHNFEAKHVNPAFSRGSDVSKQ